MASIALDPNGPIFDALDVRGAVARVVRLAGLAIDLYCERRDLEELDEDALRDTGLTRRAIAQANRKSAWRRLIEASRERDRTRR